MDRHYEMPEKVYALDIELVLSRYFSYTKNLIVPNVSWGLNMHEVDLLIISKSGYATEVEIKISKSDLKADLDKRHKHYDERIKYLYFALPSKLREAALEFVPERAGIILLNNTDTTHSPLSVEIIRKPVMQKARKLTEKEMYKAARLGALRIWGLKTKHKNLKKLNSIYKQNLKTIIPAVQLLAKLQKKTGFNEQDKKVFKELMELGQINYNINYLWKLKEKSKL